MKLMYTVVFAVCLGIAGLAMADTDPNLPTFTYNLTAETKATRNNLCLSNEDYCMTDCGGTDKAPMNFCNVTTMGWGCGCIDHIPTLEGYEWPINNADCRGRGEACKAACLSSSIPDANKSACNNACVSTYSAKCGTPDAPAANYVVSDVNQIPSYGFGNSKTGNSSNGTSGQNQTGSNSGNSGAKSPNSAALPIGMTYSIGSIVLALTVVMGMMIVN